MHLIRTTCCTDGDGYPTHTITRIATIWSHRADVRESLIERMNQDVREWMAHNITADGLDEEMLELAAGANYTELDEAVVAKALNKMLDGDKLKISWAHRDNWDGNWEVKAKADQMRVFVERRGDSICTTVYHLAENLAIR